MFYHFKCCHALLNGLASLVMAAGLIVGSVLENSIVVAGLAAMGTVVKGWNDFKKFSLKVDMCHFAYTSYSKTLIELRTYVRGLPFDKLDGFLVKMQTLDDTITDFTPPVSDACTREYGRRFQYVPVEGNCFADGCPGPPNLNTSHLPLIGKLSIKVAFESTVPGDNGEKNQTSIQDKEKVEATEGWYSPVSCGCQESL